MSQRPGSVKVLGLEIPFKPGTDMERIRCAAGMLEIKYEEQRQKLQGQGGHDRQMVCLALDLADDLLQLKLSIGDMQTRINALLEKIENHRI